MESFYIGIGIASFWALYIYIENDLPFFLCDFYVSGYLAQF